jgi:small-conductance mechanosensitive channel
MDQQMCTRGRIGMSSPIVPWGPLHRPDDDDLTRAKRLEQLNRGYEDSPWLTFLVFFSGFVAAVPGSMVAVYLIGDALTRRAWWPYAVLLAVLVGIHMCLRAVRYRRRRAR